MTSSSRATGSTRNCGSGSPAGSSPNGWRPSEAPISLRWPERHSASPSAVVNPLELEIAAEKASALGRAGERVERCLADLGAAGRDSPQRTALLKDAADAVYGYFIQRELCGMRRHHDVIRDYGIPNEVLVRLGAK